MSRMRRFHSWSRMVVALAAVIAATVTALAGGSVAYADREYSVTTASTQQQTAQISHAFADSPAVRVCEYGSFPCVGVGGVAVTFSAPSSGASGTFPNGTSTTTVTSAANGLATAPTFTANGTTGSYSMRIAAVEPTCYDDPSGQNDPQWCATPNFLFFTNSLDAPNRATEISTGDGSSQAAVIGGTFGSPLNAIVFISAAGPVFATGIPVTFIAPDSGASGTFVATGTNRMTVFTGSTGVATTSAFRANSTVGTYFVTATVRGTYTATHQDITTSFALTNSATNVNGVPYIVSAAAGNGQNAGTLAPFATNLQVVVLDGSGHYVQGATVDFIAPWSGPSGTFAGGSRTYTTTTGPTGLATAPTFTSNDVVGSYAVEVEASRNGVTATGVIGLSNGRVKTTTTVTTSPSGSSVYGQPVTLTATVQPQTGTLVPAAPVTFKNAGTAITGCTGVNPSGGVATCTLHGLTSLALTPGSYSFSADYPGDAISQPSTSTAVAYTVGQAFGRVALATSAPAFVLFGDSVTFTATVSVDEPGHSGPPTAQSLTGTVRFTTTSGTLLNGGNPVPLVNGSAQVSTSALPVGANTIIATYSGDANFQGSAQGLTQNVYTLPDVTADPTGTLVLVEDTANFSAAAIGVPAPAAQWQVSTDHGATFTDIPGATAATHSAPNATATTYSVATTMLDNQKQYRAVFTNPAGSDPSQAATLTIIPPVLTLSNLSATDVADTKATLHATVTPTNRAIVSRRGFMYHEGSQSFDPANPPIGTVAIHDLNGGPGSYAVTIGTIGPLSPATTYSYVAFSWDDVHGVFGASSVGTFTTRAKTNLSPATSSGTYGGTTTLSATLTSGGNGLGGKTVSFTLNGASAGTATTNASGVATLTNVTLGSIAAGTYPTGVGASFAGDAIYYASNDTAALTVNQADQSLLTATVTPASGVVGDTLALGSMGGSGGGAVSFNLGASTACALGTGADAGKLLLVNAGTCSVKVTKAGDTNYHSATSTSATVVVGQASTSLAVAAGSANGSTTALSATLTRTPGGVPLSGMAVSFTLNGASAGTATTNSSGVASLANASLAGIAAGSYPAGVGASFAGNANYLPSSGTAGLTIKPAPPALTGTTPASPANNNSPAVTGTAKAGATVTLYTGSACSSAVAGSGTAGDNGAFSVTASVADNSTTTISATATIGGVTSDCSTTSTTYVEDSTPPSIAASAKQADNTTYAAGMWIRQNVTVHYECADPGGSGVASCPADQPFTASAVSTSGTATDNAGNTASASFGPISIDAISPTIDAAATSAPNGANDWYTSNVTVHFTCADTGGSGLAGACPGDQTLSGEGAAVSSTAQTIADQAGNTASSNVVTAKIDKTSPTISAAVSAGTPGANGWYTSNVTVHFTCADNTGGSGLAGSCPADQVFSAAGAALSSTAQTGTDLAGNVGAPSNVVTVKIDKTAPDTIITSAVDGSAKTVRDGNSTKSPAITFSFTGSDSGSGVAGLECQLDGGSLAPCTSPQTYPSLAVGSHSFGVRAVDQAGNVDASPATFTWTVGQGSGAASYTLSVTTQGQGTVTTSDGGITCRSSMPCTKQYPAATPITLSAAPSNGWKFDHWAVTPTTAGTCAGTTTCAVTISGSVSVTAVFKRA